MKENEEKEKEEKEKEENEENEEKEEKEDINEDEEEEEEEEGAWGRLVSLTPKCENINMIDDEITIGRHKSCTNQINFPQISAKHCRIWREFDQIGGKFSVYIEDLSSNGTFLGSEKIGKNNKMLLQNGTDITLLMRAQLSERISFIYQNLDVPSDEVGIEKDYFLSNELGSGSFAVVKLGVHKQTGEKYAIKVVNKKKASMNQGKRSRLMDEVAILMKVDHPNIIGIKQVYDSPEHLYLVLELVTGGELFDHIINNGKFSEEKSRQLFYQMLTAVDYIHSMGISHRDLKPENILLKSHDEHTIKISDFGLSRIIGEGSFMKTLCGTPQYLAPEILSRLSKNNSESIGYGKEVDIWALGVILYILLCGYHPFTETEVVPILKKIKHGEFSFPDEDWAEVSESAKDLIRGLMTVDPSKRLTAKEAFEHPWMKIKADAEKGGEEKKEEEVISQGSQEGESTKRKAPTTPTRVTRKRAKK